MSVSIWSTKKILPKAIFPELDGKFVVTTVMLGRRDLH